MYSFWRALVISLVSNKSSVSEVKIHFKIQEPVKKQHFLAILLLYLEIVLVVTVLAYPVPEDDKTFNLKIGFDLTHGENGAPSLRIRDFEESREYNPRAGDDKKKGGDSKDKSGPHAKPSVRADSGSESGDNKEENESPKAADKKASSEESKSAESKSPPPKASGGSDDDVDDEDDSDVDTKHSTRGLGAAEYEPEGTYKQQGANNRS
ncbi:nuclear ubiquitous casein and cyclin-dependent kinase substrate 1-like [Pectinophora gossypiella]|uniref:nuclear ubiquitous casein and cyclin-dependent kinase substrate 1-like n=1 Tax=Pectinophora gossypiella TaxID=13191 RepID=UPI00214EE240|nr:nuclear ubiquitous casein and cyclin-dependent kinase substrate 1-like [Pectinophora gossypiella]